MLRSSTSMGYFTQTLTVTDDKVICRHQLRSDSAGRRCVVSGFLLVGDVLFQGFCWLEMCYFSVYVGRRCVVSGLVMVKDMSFQVLCWLEMCYFSVCAVGDVLFQGL